MARTTTRSAWQQEPSAQPGAITTPELVLPLLARKPLGIRRYRPFRREHRSACLVGGNRAEPGGDQRAGSEPAEGADQRQQLRELLQSVGAATAPVRVAGNSILTMRATARLRLQNEQTSDLKRTVAAMVKYMPVGYDAPIHILSWYDMPGAIEIYKAAPVSIPKDFRRLLAFGSGVGIQIGETDLEVARVRPSRIRCSDASRVRTITRGRRRSRAPVHAAGAESRVGSRERHGASAEARGDRETGNAAACGGQRQGRRDPVSARHAASVPGRGGLPGLVGAARRRGAHSRSREDASGERQTRPPRRKKCSCEVFSAAYEQACRCPL